MNEFKVDDNLYPMPDEIKFEDKIVLKNQTCTVRHAEDATKKIINPDWDLLAPLDLRFLKKIGVYLCGVNDKDTTIVDEVLREETVKQRIARWFMEDSTANDDDDSVLFMDDNKLIRE